MGEVNSDVVRNRGRYALFDQSGARGMGVDRAQQRGHEADRIWMFLRRPLKKAWIGV
jgi:hypothetical protein